LRHYKCWGKLKDAATRCVLRPVDAPECICGRGSAPDPAGEAYSAAPDPLAGFVKGRIERSRGGKETELERTEGEVKGEEGKGNEI